MRKLKPLSCLYNKYEAGVSSQLSLTQRLEAGGFPPKLSAWLHTTKGKWENMCLCNLGELTLLSVSCLHPTTFSQFILPTPPKLTPPEKVFKALWSWTSWLAISHFFQVGKLSRRLSEDWTLNVPAIIVLSIPICDCVRSPLYFQFVKMAWS